MAFNSFVSNITSTSNTAYAQISQAIIRGQVSTAISLLKSTPVSTNEAVPWTIPEKPQGSTMGRYFIEYGHTTILQQACFFGPLSLVEFIVLQAGGNPNIWVMRDGINLSSFDFAIDGSHIDVINFIMQMTSQIPMEQSKNGFHLTPSTQMKVYVLARAMINVDTALMRICIGNPGVMQYVLFLKTLSPSSSSSLPFSETIGLRNAENQNFMQRFIKGRSAH